VQKNVKTYEEHFAMRIITAILVLFISAGCSTVAHLRTDGQSDSVTESVKAKDVKVYVLRDIGKPYKIIGTVVASADAGENASVAVELLKGEAAALGAEAVVDLHLRVQQGYWRSAIEAVGLAVHLKEGK
jgi:uncharacterized protein YbjQ (UPF0145 family)